MLHLQSVDNTRTNTGISYEESGSSTRGRSKVMLKILSKWWWHSEEASRG